MDINILVLIKETLYIGHVKGLAKFKNYLQKFAHLSKKKIMT